MQEPATRRTRPLVPLLGLGLVLNLALLALYYTPAPKVLQGDEYYYTGLAMRVARGLPSEHSPFWPPFYGELMGRVLAVSGGRLWVVQALQIAGWLAAGAALHRTALRIAPAPVAAHVTAGLFLLSPELMGFSHFFWPEMLHLVLATVALWLLVCHARRLAAVAASGVLLGLAILSKLLLLPVAPLVPVAFALATPMAWRARLGRALVLGAAIALTLAPTALGNLERTGELTIGDSSALVLWLGLNPTFDHPAALREFMGAGPDMATRNAVYRRKVAEQVRRQGLLGTLERQIRKQYFQLLSYETFFTLQLPSDAPTMKGRYRFPSRRMAAALHLWAHLAHAVLLAAAALGVAAVRPWPPGWWTVLLGFLAYNLGLFLIANTNARYFVQMMPAVMLFAGVGAWWAAELVRGRTPTGHATFAFGRTRLAAGLALAALLEYVAFRSLPALGL